MELMEFPIGPNEFLLLLILAMLGYGLKLLKDREEKRLEGMVISIIRSRDGVTIDEIIIDLNIPVDKATKIVKRLVSKGVIKTEKRNGKTYYVIA